MKKVWNDFKQFWAELCIHYLDGQVMGAMMRPYP